VERHGAEKLAAAFIRLYRQKHSAPEELIEVSLGYERKPRGENSDFPATRRGPCEEFGPSVWFSLSVGRKQNAGPCWLIPILCRNGNLSTGAIVAIKMQPDETFVEIAAAHADTFSQSIGKDRTLERGISVKRLYGVPDFSRRSE